MEFNVSGEIKTDELAFHLKNNAKFIGAVNTKKTTVEMQDLSLANFKGFSDDAEIKIKDTANILAPYWRIENLEIDSKNGNYTELNVDQELKGKVTNTAKIIYYGNPSKKIKVEEKATLENRDL